MQRTKKSILFLPRWYPNKTDIQLGTFIRQQALLLKEDFDISVIYIQADSTANQKFNFIENTKDGIHEIIVYFKEGTGFLKKIINAKRYEKAQKLAYKKLNRSVELCHVHVPYRPAALALYLLRTSQIPFVITEHWSGHLTGDFQKKNKLDKALYNSVLKKASAISCVSELLQKKFKLNTGYDSVVISNYIETAPATAPAPIPESKSDKINILSVTDMADEIKNISGLITAFNYALKENNKLHLTIIGGGPDEEKIKKIVDQFQLSSYITLAGRLNHEAVLKAMHESDFYVCNSNTETFGMTVAEALRSGKPVISTKCGGPEEFLNRENSILIEPKNNDQLKNALLQMADEFPKFDSKKLSEDMENKFGKEVVKAKWILFYQSVLK